MAVFTRKPFDRRAAILRKAECCREKRVAGRALYNAQRSADAVIWCLCCRRVVVFAVVSST